MSDSTPLTPGPGAPAANAGPSHDGTASAGASKVNPFARGTYAKALNRGYGDALGRGLELALTVLVMVGLGLLVDRMLGTAPLFAIVFTVVGFAGITVKLWLGYDLEMRKHESDAVWNRKDGATS